MTRKKKRVFPWILAALGILLLVFGPELLSQELETTCYSVSSPKVPQGSSVRVALLSDLHNRQYGEDNRELVELIARQEPDLILMAGDMFTKGDSDYETVLSLCRQLRDIAPIYFGLGNHEGTIIYNEDVRIDGMLVKEGVHVLISSAVETQVNGVPILIGSVAVSEQLFDEYAAEFIEEYEKSDALKLLITHIPSLYYEKMAQTEIDLGLCGHFHGGVVQLPILGGVYSVDYGLFPQYCSGMHQLENSTIVVSRGLGEHRNIPRINNRPELVVIDICSQETDASS